MKPLLNTTPLSAIHAIENTVLAFDGSLNISTPDQCKKGMGIHMMVNVKKPNNVVNRFGWNPNGGGYTASDASTPLIVLSLARDIAVRDIFSSSSSGIDSYCRSAAASGSDGKAAYIL